MILWLISLLLGYGVFELQAISPPNNQPYRTGFHFQPLKNYMNDPNGPMYYKGLYHLFYQYNTVGNGSSNGPRVWGHSTSTNLIDWTPQPIALQPSSSGESMYSGSTTIRPGNKPSIIFTLHTPNLEVQEMAVPKNFSDPYLKEWIVIPQNPVIIPTQEIDPLNFRDPTTAWILPDSTWRVIVGSVSNNQGMALLYKSKDFIQWVKVNHSLYSEQNSGMWECPDFFAVYKKDNRNEFNTYITNDGAKYVLKASLAANQHDVYSIGTYDLKNDQFVPDQGFVNDSSLRYDYGKFYASKTFYDAAKKRRILFAWIMECISDADGVTNGWAGIQGIPRSIWLDKSGKQLIQWPVSELEMLREKPVSLRDKVISGGSIIEVSNITAAQADVEVLINFTDLKNAEKFESNWTNNPQLSCNQNGLSKNGEFGPFGLLTLASKGLEEYTAIYFRIFYDNNKHVVLMCSDQTRSSVNTNPEKTLYGAFMDVDPTSEGLALRVLIDHSVVESYGGKGKAVITARVYPTIAIDENAHLYVFNNGTNSIQLSKLSAWSMSKAQIA